MTSDILLLNKLEQQENDKDFALFSLDEQIRKAILLVNDRWHDKEIAYEIHLEKAAFFGKESLLYQVWINLLDNAIKFSGDAASLRISLKQNAAHIHVSIEDHGQGIPPAELENIFIKFYKGDLSRHSEGNGLGLSIVKQIVELHKGVLEVRSVPGEGTTFSVILNRFENETDQK